MLIQKIGMVLVLVGALNWGLVGVTSLFGSEFDLVQYIFTGLIGLPVLTNIVYVIVGIAAIILAVTSKKGCCPGSMQKGGGMPSNNETPSTPPAGGM